MVSSKKLRKPFIALLKISVSLLAIYLIINQVNSQNLKDILRNSDPAYLGLGLLLLILSQFSSAHRLKYLLEVCGAKVPGTWNLKLYFVGMAYNLFLPGGVGGDAYKVMLLNRKYQVPKKQLAFVLILDRLSGLLAILVLSLALSHWVMETWPLQTLWWVSIPFGVAFSAYLMKRFAPNYFPLFPKVSVLALGIQILQVVSILCLAYAVDFEATFIDVSFIFLLSTLATTIPVFLGGIGAREGVFALVAGMWVLNSEKAVATALCFSAITIIASLPGLYFDWTISRESTPVVE
jgi:uncharacterized membrane protein YbhN (UPF0104 family)